MVFTELNYTPLQEVVNAWRQKMRKWQLSWLSPNAPESRTRTLHSSSLLLLTALLREPGVLGHTKNVVDGTKTSHC